MSGTLTGYKYGNLVNATWLELVNQEAVGWPDRQPSWCPRMP